MKQESVQFHTVILSCWKKTLVLVCEWKRATVQVPTGLHSQTVMTGWSNYWAVDTPAWREFISSRKGDSQITVYPHPAPSSDLIPLMRSHQRQTPWHCWHSRACNHPHAFKALLRRSHPATACIRLFILHVSICVATGHEQALVSRQTHLLQSSKHTEWQH